MKTPAVKRVRFALIINIVSVVTSLLYVILSLAYFIAMTSMANGNEYEVLGFIFGLIGLPVVLVFMVIPIFRIIILICTIFLNKKIITGKKATGLRVSTGIMQILDAIASFIIFSFTSSVAIMFSTDLLQSIFGTGRFFSIMYCFIGFCAIIPSLVKGILQIVSAVFLFTLKNNESISNTVSGSLIG